MLFCFCTDEKDVEKIVYEVDQVLGGGELSLPVYPGVGNRPLKKIANAQCVCVCVWGGGGGWGGAWLQVKLNHALFVVPGVTRSDAAFFNDSKSKWSSFKKRGNLHV